ncbi:MAG TPA: transglutaminase-like domain-containing protein [Chryseolinea sp.]|nr:transglutaminase-like domain-containing protein [Chryseolinea sp.]
MNKTHSLALVITLCFLQQGIAQNSDVFKTMKSKFPEDAAVFVERSEVLSILLKNDSLEIFSDFTEDKLHLKEQSDVYAAGRVYGSHFNQVKDIKAKTLVWDKSRFKEMAVSDFKKNSDRDDGIFYDDSYYYSFKYPSVASGNRTQLQYRSVVKDARFIPGYIFTTYLPQAKTTYTIKTSRQVELVYNVLNDPKHLIKFRKYEKGGFQYYEWSATDLTPTRSEENSPSIRYFATHVICYVKSYENKNGKVNMLSDLGDLYRWYYNFVPDMNAEPSQELKVVVDAIVKKSKSELETVRNVFYWVQNNIQYVAFEEGMRGLIPHTGSYVCEKRYGDCKDMASLIVTMLKIANVKAYHTWIGTRDLPYKYSEVPTPLVDNHMIATYIDNNQRYYFLDATSDHTAFGLPSSMIQGKEALIGFDKNKYEVKLVPEMSKETSAMNDSIFIHLDGNQIAGKGKTSLSGYAKVFGGYELDRSEKDDVKRYVTRLIGKGSNKFYLDGYNLANLENRDIPTRIDYTFRIGDYFQKIGDELYINLHLKKDYYNAFIDKTREAPMEITYKYVENDFCEFIIPEGYDVEYLPSSVKVNGELVGMETAYKRDNNKIIFTKKFYIDRLLVMPGDFENWNNSIKELSEVYKESIILKKK